MVNGVVNQVECSHAMWKDDLTPLKHMIAKWRSKMVILLWITFIVKLYEKECFSEVKEASLLYMTDAEGPHPPVIERTMEVNVPCLTSLTLLSFTLLFSCLLYSLLQLLQCNSKMHIYGLSILMSKNALFLLLCQNPWALVSSLALSFVLAVLSWNVSLASLYTVTYLS